MNVNQAKLLPFADVYEWLVVKLSEDVDALPLVHEVNRVCFFTLHEDRLATVKELGHEPRTGPRDEGARLTFEEQGMLVPVLKDEQVNLNP